MNEITKKRTKLSIASFILSLIFFIPLACILAIIFGIAALIKIHRHHNLLRGERLAIAGIILGSLSLLLWIVIVIFMLTIAPQIRPSLLEIGQNVKIAKAQIDLVMLEQAIKDYHKQYNKLPGDLKVLEESGLIDVLPRDPFSKNKEIYKYKTKEEAKKIYKNADFLIYSLGPDGDDDGAQRQYSTKESDGDIVRIIKMSYFK